MKECKLCGAYKGHSPLCENNSPEEIKEHLKTYFQAFQRNSNVVSKIKDNCKQRIIMMSKYITATNGKIAVLKHENNQLRKKIYPNK